MRVVFNVYFVINFSNNYDAGKSEGAEKLRPSLKANLNRGK